MADDINPELNGAESDVPSQSKLRVRRALTMREIVEARLLAEKHRASGRFTVTRAPFTRPRAPEYAEWKAMLSVAVDDIKTEMRAQHVETRSEIKSASLDILEAVKRSPAAYIKVMCEFGALLMTFSLALRLLVRIELINTLFAVFVLFSCALYWTMAEVSQRSSRSKRK